jgi:hypothetical protein
MTHARRWWRRWRNDIDFAGRKRAAENSPDPCETGADRGSHDRLLPVAAGISAANPTAAVAAISDLNIGDLHRAHST